MTHRILFFLLCASLASSPALAQDDVLEKIATTATHPQDRPDKRMGVESIKIVPADSVK